MKTINKFLLLLGSLAMTAGMTGCEDKRGEHLEDYASRIYFRNSGDQTISLYRVGKNTFYDVPVCKSGSDLSYTADVTVAAVEQSQLDIYNMQKETRFVQLPNSCYKFTTDTNLHFAAGEISKVVTVELLTDNISLLQEANPKTLYVLALQVYSSDRPVSANVNLLILEPIITVPVVAFTKPGLNANNLNADSPTDVTITGEVFLDMEDVWSEDFTCKLGVHDQAWLDDYNAEHETNYVLMPLAYELGEVKFTPESNKANFSVKFDRTGMDLFTEYVIPLYLADCSVKYGEDKGNANVFKLDDKVFLMHAVYMPVLDKIVLEDRMLKTDYTSKATGDNLPVSAVIDGDNSTYWHSSYDKNTCPAGDPIYGVYIDITLDEPKKVIQFRYLTRTSNNNGVPTQIRIGASIDGVNWTMVQEVNSGLPGAAGAWGELPMVQVDEEPYKYYRFGVAKSAAGDCCADKPEFTALGELELYGTNNL